MKFDATQSSKRITSVDVAHAAGVSQSVVSRAFDPNGKVAAQTRTHVLAVAKCLGYQPNVYARSLVMQKANIVGIIVGNIDNPFYPSVLMRFSEALQKQGRQVLLFSSKDEEEVGDALLQALQYRVEAVIVTSVTLTSSVTQTLEQSQVPIFLFNRTLENVSLPSVSCDNVAGGRLVAETFLKAGHERFAFIGGAPNTSTNRDRRRGFLERLQEVGAPCICVEQTYSYEWGYEAAAQLLGRGLPDAIFCANDIIALGTLDALRLEEVRVPEEVAVIGFDDITEARRPAYSLTTVRQPVEEMIEATLSLLEQPAPKTQLLRGQLVERSSSRPVKEVL